MDINNIPRLLDIAARAIEVSDAQRLSGFCRSALREAYRAWKRQNGIGRVEVDTPEWDRMMAETVPAYERLRKAQASERNASRRLATAVKRLKGGEA